MAMLMCYSLHCCPARLCCVLWMPCPRSPLFRTRPSETQGQGPYRQLAQAGSEDPVSDGYPQRRQPSPYRDWTLDRTDKPYLDTPYKKFEKAPYNPDPAALESRELQHLNSVLGGRQRPAPVL